MTLIIDTGFFYATVDATVDATDRHHKTAVATLGRIYNERLILPTSVVVELGILMNERLG